jgi:hypothetical protein
MKTYSYTLKMSDNSERVVTFPCAGRAKADRRIAREYAGAMVIMCETKSA